MRDITAFELIKKELERLDRELQGQETEDDYRAGVVLLTAVWITGTDIEKLRMFTGYDRDFLTAISRRMHKSGLWEEGNLVHSDHRCHEDSYSSAVFWTDVLVGLGTLQYAGRYVRRPPIAQRRIIRIDKQNVVFWFKDKKLRRLVAIQCSLEDFIDLWSQHVLERYQHSVRNFGLFARARSARRQ